MKPFAYDDRAFTGLEAAMVFIAFIVVASVFAYVALGAGFFTTQKTEQTVYSSVKQVGAVVQIAEPVMVQASADGQHVRHIVVMVKVPPGGDDIDVERIVVTVSTADFIQTYEGATWWHPIESGGGAERPIFWYVKIPLFQADDPLVPEDQIIGQNQRFFVELKPSDAVPFTVERMAPAGMRPGSWYEV
ncbi:Archaebacterial flagellin [anaerobic digester metagenome]